MTSDAEGDNVAMTEEEEEEGEEEAFKGFGQVKTTCWHNDRHWTLTHKICDLRKHTRAHNGIKNKIIIRLIIYSSSFYYTNYLNSHV